ncbi:MFS transporter [Bacillus sp. DTU_2020_1000418_1_SI_GHA_SEK_038]|uniref:MFS transporter n=1 Tax=Bacillus sp. DTU_2020_1000418_1_SI_GHA_SEK_038 TaxID=3077585 RepID=UPI0028EB7676|nr:MFS transporter [Bacillus sp. DTU_2020_1000418_1_SI_GHA_SEK_038]WNS73809.1 MFS transporter [Bacillus sp. DTU_2020_1000418_1_SI_GHA_SEK_038]
MEHVEKLEIGGQKAKKKSRRNVHNKKWAVLSLATIPLVMTLGNSMLIPVLPAMEKNLNITSLQTSMILTVYSIVAIILIPVAGGLSDYIGRKKVIIPSLLIAGIGGLISGWAAWKANDAYWIILCGRALQGVGAAGAAPIVMPLIGDMFKSDDEVSSSLGMIETSNTFGKVLSPILGAYLASFFWFLPFFAFPVFCALSILLVWLLIKTPKEREEPVPFKQFLVNIKKTFTHNGKWLYAIFVIGVIMMFVLFGVLFYLSDVLEKKYDIINIKKGLLLAVPLGALCLASFITGKIIKENKILMKWIIFGGTVLTAVSVGILSFSNGLWFMLILFTFGGIGIGVALPCLDALITCGIEKKERGTITSIYSSMRFIGVAAGPPVMALLMKNTEKLLFYFLSGLTVIAILATFMAIKPDEENA